MQTPTSHMQQMKDGVRDLEKKKKAENEFKRKVLDR